MDFAVLEAFVAVVERGGFTRASGALHLSQPALSRRIALLEHELGQPVFERGRHGARLTDAGRTFLPHAQQALACVRDGVVAVRALAQGDTGSLTLAIVGTLASTDLATRLGRFRDAHPRVRLLLRTGSSAEVSALVRRGEATLGLRYFADAAPDVASRELSGEEMVVVASARHPLARARRVSARRLAGDAWVGFPPRRGTSVDPFGQVLARGLAAAGLDDAELVVVDSLTAQKRLVEAGFGVALVPSSSVREEITRGSLVALDVPEMRAHIDVVLIHRKAAYLSAAARRLADVLSVVEPSRRARRPSPAPRRRPVASARGSLASRPDG